MKHIRLFVILFLLLAFEVYAEDRDTFKSVTVGIEVTKPSVWSFASTQEILENLKSIKLNDEQFHQLMLKYSTVPLVAMMKYPEPYDDINPSFKVNIKPFGQHKGADGKQVISSILPQFNKMFKDFIVVQAPIDTEVSGLKAAYSRFNYSLQIPDGREFPTSSELWIVPRGDYFFLIGAGTRQDEKTGSRDEIKQILSTVKIDK